MTKKDYIRAAELVRDIYRNDGQHTGATVERAFERFFLGDNPRFDSERFCEACRSGKVFASRKHFEKGE